MLAWLFMLTTPDVVLAKASHEMPSRAYPTACNWGQDYFGDTKTLDVHVKRLRQKIEPDPHQPEHLLTVRCLGYRFVDQAAGEKSQVRP
jgi:DNA-binding response OmpR family regulator